MEAPSLPTRFRTVLHLLFYAGGTLLVAASFLSEILQGNCPVP